MYLIFEGFLLITFIGMFFVFHTGSFAWMFLLKIMASLCFLMTGFCGYMKDSGRRTFSRPMFMALLCSMAGDVLLALGKKQGILFVLGVASFAGAHVLFSIAFCRVSAIAVEDMIGTLVVFGGLLLLLLSGPFAFHGIQPVLIGYGAVISFMTVKALSLWRCRKEGKSAAVLIMSGGVLFLLSDIVLLFWMFGIGMPRTVQAANWILYYLAQGCLSASLSAKKQAGLK